MEQIFPQSLCRNQPGLHLDFRLPASKTAREHMTIVLNLLGLWLFVIAALGN